MKNEEKSLNSWLTIIKSTDYFIIQLTMALVLLGIIFSFSSSAYESYRLTKSFWTLGLKQLSALSMGLLLLVLFWQLNYKVWFKLTWPLACFSLILMLITVFSNIGKASGGSQRWIDFGFFQFQPAEIAKLAVILLLAKFLTKYKWNEFKSYYYFLFLLVLILTVLKQPDLGSATILVILVLQSLFIFGWPIIILIFISLSGALLGYLKIFSTPYQLDRIKFWLHPYLEPQGRGYNLIQAKYAFGFGGISGVGLGNSLQKQGNLPVPHSDFIFAIIAEEIGLLGITAILLIYSMWIIRGLYIVNLVQEKYGRILGTLIIFLISTQAIINISVAVGLLPITGVTLPFFSCGGTSLIITLTMCGILLNIMSTSKQKTPR